MLEDKSVDPERPLSSRVAAIEIGYATVSSGVIYQAKLHRPALVSQLLRPERRLDNIARMTCE
jgi:hypothetical protein